MKKTRKTISNKALLKVNLSLAIKKSSVSLVISFLIFSLIFSNVSFTSGGVVSADIVSQYEMAVDLSDYSLDVKDSMYYAWRGSVNLTGSIQSEEVSETKICAYLDNEIVPIFTLETSEMSLVNGKYSFTAVFNTVNYKRGFHTFRIYDGQIVSFTDKTPVVDVPIYIDYAEMAEIYNVTTDCNMRSQPTREASVVVSPKLGDTVDILGSETGQTVSGTGTKSSYNTNIWYKVNYEKNSSVYTGYILSAFLEKTVTGISKMKVTAQDATIPEFFLSQQIYALNLPYSSFDLKISDLVLYNKDDTVKAFINGVEALPPYTSLPLKTGDNTVEFKCQSALSSASTTYTYTIWRIAQSTEAEFNAQLAKFPESYKTGLKLLHSKYPKWLFTAFNTNITWDSVLDNEDSGSTSLIENSNPATYKYSDTVLDGDSFVRASSAAVEYYLDPRNFFDEQSVFQFEQLSYQPNVHTIAGVQKLTDGSGLSGKQQLFINAAIASGVSPYHLAARSKQEVTVWSPQVGLSSLASGKYTGANGVYNGLYNFYNIGTGSGQINYIIWRGLNFSKGNKSGGTEATFFQGLPKTAEEKAKYNLPWNSEADAITGGAKYIGATYINQGQDTLYLQKFDVDPINGLYSHQYMQNVQAPYSEAKNSYKAYSQTGGLSNSFVFRIPVYSNMPSLSAPKPENTNKLSSIKVIDQATKAEYTLTPTFDPSKETQYQTTVFSTTSKVTISASTLNSKATITGTGDKTLELGSINQFVISCTPTSGTKRDYIVNINRPLPEISSDNYLTSLSVTSDSYSIVQTPTFNMDNKGPYSVLVPDSCDELSIEATAHDLNATITGTGLKSIAFGKNDFSITVKAQNGSERIYTLSVTRLLPKLSSTTLVLADSTIKGVKLLSTVDSIRKELSASLASIKIIDSKGKECIGTTLVGTGMKVQVSFQNAIIEEYGILLYGDVNGDGKINSTDITIFKRHILRLGTLTGKFLEASDVNKDGKYNSTDYTIIKRSILRLQTISQK